VRVSPGAGAVRGSTAGPEHAVAMSKTSSVPSPSGGAARTIIGSIRACRASRDSWPIAMKASKKEEQEKGAALL
jgi:hypothetical protein